MTGRIIDAASAREIIEDAISGTLEIISSGSELTK